MQSLKKIHALAQMKVPLIKNILIILLAGSHVSSSCSLRFLFLSMCGIKRYQENFIWKTSLDLRDFL